MRTASKLFPCSIALVLVCCVVGCNLDGPLESAPLSVVPPFSVVIDGDNVAVRVVRSEPLYLQQCTGREPVLEKQQGGGWVPLRDDRPSSSSGQAYFLDGKFERNPKSMCCLASCTQLGNPIAAGFLREYVKTGTQAAPAGAEGATATEVDVIETRAFSGPLRVRLLYSTTDACSAVHEALPTIDVPIPPEDDRVGPAPEQQPAPEPGYARELVAKSYEAALHSPHRIEWAPEEIIPRNTVFDLCDEVQATEAGLLSYMLEEARHLSGVDCRTSKRRFTYVSPHGSLQTATSYEEAVADLTELAEKGSINGERFTKPVGVLMSHRGSRATDMDPCGAGFGCARASIDVSRGTTRGMFANVSDQVAHNVTIRAGTVVAHYRLSVQPGENTAFELPAELSAAELATLSITATFVGSADPRRAVHLMGAPGDITGRRDELARRYFGIDPLRDPPIITYFLEAIILENSTTHPDAAQSLPGKVLDSPVAVVALLDESGKVMQVLRPPVTFDKDGRSPVPVTTMAFAETYAIGFVMPPEVAQYSISIGGAE